jgi:hypothetical protein
MAKDLLKLQTKLTEVQEKLSKARIELASIMVNTYVYTSGSSPFFEMKNLIFESKNFRYFFMILDPFSFKSFHFTEWYDKIDQYSAEEEMRDAAKSAEAVKCPSLGKNSNS